MCSSETSVDIYRITQCYIPEDGTLHEELSVHPLSETRLLGGKLKIAASHHSCRCFTSILQFIICGCHSEYSWLQDITGSCFSGESVSACSYIYNIILRV
jgi:hypothetical protein